MTQPDETPPVPDPPAYSPYMGRQEARAALDAHLDLLTEWEDHPEPDVRAFVAERRASAEAAFVRLDVFYANGALPRHHDIPEDDVDQARARNLGQPWPRPSLWARLTGKA